MTKAQIDAVKFIKMLAENARRELSTNADRGTSARPTVKQINSTLDRLSSMIDSADACLIGEDVS